MSTTPKSGLSRRALFGIGGSTLLAVTAFTAWRGRTSSIGAPKGLSDASIAAVLDWELCSTGDECVQQDPPHREDALPM